MESNSVDEILEIEPVTMLGTDRLDLSMIEPTQRESASCSTADDSMQHAAVIGAENQAVMAVTALNAAVSSLPTDHHLQQAAVIVAENQAVVMVTDESSVENVLELTETKPLVDNCKTRRVLKRKLKHKENVVKFRAEQKVRLDEYLRSGDVKQFKSMIVNRELNPNFKYNMSTPLIKKLVSHKRYEAVAWLLKYRLLRLKKRDIKKAFKTSCNRNLPEKNCIRHFLVAAVSKQFISPIELFRECLDRKHFDVLDKLVIQMPEFDPNEILEDDPPYWQTPLHAVVNWGKLSCARKLIERGAAVEVLDSRHRTPLMLAVGHLDHEMVRLLLRNGANPNPKTSPTNFWWPLLEPIQDIKFRSTAYALKSRTYPDYEIKKFPEKLSKNSKKANLVVKYLIAAGLVVKEDTWIHRTILIRDITKVGCDLLRQRATEKEINLRDAAMTALRNHLVEKTNGGCFFSKMCYTLLQQNRITLASLRILLVKSI